MKRVVSNAVAACAALIILGMLVSVKLGYPETGTYHVENIEKIWNLGAKDEGFYPYDCYYMVYTDDGVFKVELSGFNAYAYGAGLIKAGKTYVLKTRGARIEMWGLYPNIINAEEYEN